MKVQHVRRNKWTATCLCFDRSRVIPPSNALARVENEARTVLDQNVGEKVRKGGAQKGRRAAAC